MSNKKECIPWEVRRAHRPTIVENNYEKPPTPIKDFLAREEICGFVLLRGGNGPSDDLYMCCNTGDRTYRWINIISGNRWNHTSNPPTPSPGKQLKFVKLNIAIEGVT